MESGFSYGDIIVIGAIAAFILLRYRAMLGEKTGRDAPPPRSKPTLASEFERVIQLPVPTTKPAAEKKEDSAPQGAFAGLFVGMRAIDREFAPDEFLQGARAAYEMVLVAFSKGDRDTLKMLLSDALYNNFDRSITEGQNADRITDTTLVAITKATIADAKLMGSTATLTVDFVSEQIHLIRDAAGAILEGNPSQQNKVEDQWVFTRNLASTDPNWKIIET